MAQEKFVFIPERYCKHREIIIRNDDGEDGIIIKMADLNEAVRSGRIHGNAIVHRAIKDVK